VRTPTGPRTAARATRWPAPDRARIDVAVEAIEAGEVSAQEVEMVFAALGARLEELFP
jgi:hypothetical protein